MKPRMTKREALDEIDAKVAAGTLSRKSAAFRRRQIHHIFKFRALWSQDQQQRLYAIWAG